MKKILIILFLVFSFLAFTLKIACAQEVLAGEDYKTDVVVLNEELRKISSDIEKIYPVGSIYINASVNTNPAILFGFGTWEAFGTGKVLVGLDAADEDFDSVEETGGEKTHTLTVTEIPSHQHFVAKSGASSSALSGSNYFSASYSTSSDDAYTGKGSASPADVGLSGANSGDTAHNNLQPYITVYMWKRIS